MSHRNADLSDVILYRMKRRDGVVRTGIEIGDLTEMGTVQGEEGDYPDPVLVWYIELRLKGKKLPTQPDDVRQWLLDHAEIITHAFQRAAGDAQAGLDFATWMPFLWQIPRSPRGVLMTIACQASRRKDALVISRELVEMAEHWKDWVKTMPVLETA